MSRWGALAKATTGPEDPLYLLLGQGMRTADDQSECVVLERYRDSEAAIEHAENLGDLMEAILAAVSVIHGELLGEPSAELRAKLAGSELPHLFTPYQSM